MNVILNPDQSNTKPGDIAAIAAEALPARSRLVVLVDDTGVPEVRLPNAVTDLALYLLHETGAAGDEVGIEAIQPGHNFKVKLEGTCEAGEILVLADPTGDSGNDAGMVQDLPTAAGVYFSPGIAEEAGVDGQLVTVRPFPRMITVGTAFTGATPANTAATSTTPFGFSEAQANALVANVREMRAALIAQGIMAPNA
jgi:hypothetical protein